MAMWFVFMYINISKGRSGTHFYEDDAKIIPLSTGTLLWIIMTPKYVTTLGLGEPEPAISIIIS